MPMSPSLSRTARPARRSAPADTRPLSVLIVDDGDRARLTGLLRDTLGSQTQIRECDSGLAALEVLRRGRIDVVLVDQLLPDMSGLELVSAIADLADDTAVILMSESTSGRVAADAIKSGARDYLDRRGLDADTLETAIVSALRTSRLEWQSSRMVRQLREDQAEVDQHVRGLASDVQHSVHHLERSIDELKDIGQEPPLRRLVDHFAQVESSLRRSLEMLKRIATRSGEQK